MKQLSGMDSMMVYSEHAGLSQNMTGFYIYDPSTAPGGKVKFTDIVKLFDARLMEMPEFRRRLFEVPFNLDRPYWVEDAEVDVSRHIHHMSLPSPGDWDQLCKLAAHLHSVPLDSSRPLWEIYVIDGLDNVEGYPPGCIAVARKYHHSVLDGMTGMRLDEKVHDKKPMRFKPVRAKRRVQRTESPAPVKVWANALRNTLGIPARMTGLARNIVTTGIRERKLTTASASESIIPKVPKTRFQGHISRQRVLDGLAMDFGQLRQIKSAVADASLNDVLLAVVGGGLRRYLENTNEMPGESLVCACPIDIRTADERETGGNVIGTMSVSLHTQILDPLQRLDAVRKDTLRAKARANAGEARLLMSLYDALPSQLTSLLVRASTTDFVMERGLLGNTLLSNMPGPQHQYYLCGAKLVGMLLGPPLETGSGLLHAAISNVLNKKGVVTLGFASTPEMMPDPEFYRECLRASFEELKRAAVDLQTKD
jgi:diacylglycerol O-acyltransferase / wax synthase